MRVPCGVCPGCLKDAAAVRVAQVWEESEKASHRFGLVYQGEHGDPLSVVASKLRGYLTYCNKAQGLRGRFLLVGHDFPELGWAQACALVFGLAPALLSDEAAEAFDMEALHVFEVNDRDVLDFAGYEIRGNVDCDMASEFWQPSIGPFFGRGWLNRWRSQVFKEQRIERGSAVVRLDRCYVFRPEYRAELSLLKLSKDCVLAPVDNGRLWVPDDGTVVVSAPDDGAVAELDFSAA